MATVGTFASASISKNVNYVLVSMCTNFGAFIKKCTIGLVCCLTNTIINPQHACTLRITVVVSCVCLSACLSAHAILAVRAMKRKNERYHRVKRQICGNIKMAFSFKLSYSEVRAFFTHLGRGGHL